MTRYYLKKMLNPSQRNHVIYESQKILNAAVKYTIYIVWNKNAAVKCTIYNVHWNKNAAVKCTIYNVHWNKNAAVRYNVVSLRIGGGAGSQILDFSRLPYFVSLPVPQHKLY